MTNDDDEKEEASLFVSGGQTEDLHAAMRYLVECMHRSVSVCIPAVVVSYTRKRHLAKVLPLVKDVVLNDRENRIKNVTGKPFTVSVHFPCFGGFTVDVPLLPGDRGWVIASDVDTTTLRKDAKDSKDSEENASSDGATNKTSKTPSGTPSGIPGEDWTAEDVETAAPQKAVLLRSHEFGQGIFFPSHFAPFDLSRLFVDVVPHGFDYKMSDSDDGTPSTKVPVQILCSCAGSGDLFIGEVSSRTYPLEDIENEEIDNDEDSQTIGTHGKFEVTPKDFRKCIDGKASVTASGSMWNLYTGSAVLQILLGNFVGRVGRDARSFLGFYDVNCERSSQMYKKYKDRLAAFRSLTKKKQDQWLGQMTEMEHTLVDWKVTTGTQCDNSELQVFGTVASGSSNVLSCRKREYYVDAKKDGQDDDDAKKDVQYDENSCALTFGRHVASLAIDTITSNKKYRRFGGGVTIGSSFNVSASCRDSSSGMKVSLGGETTNTKGEVIIGASFEIGDMLSVTEGSDYVCTEEAKYDEETRKEIAPAKYEYGIGFLCFGNAATKVNVPANTTFGGRTLGSRAFMDYRRREKWSDD